jgi:hypothetical protein
MVGSVDLSGCRGYRAANWSRRGVLKVGSLALGGLSLADLLRMEQARGEQKWYESKEGTAKSVIQIVCQGGISAQESWNPKPESPTEYRGPFGVTKTPIPGVVFSETLPACAKIADKMCVVRSVVGSVPDHALGMYHMLSGHKSSPAIKHPHVGAVVSHEFGWRNGLPPFIGIPGSDNFGGVGTGYLSPKYGAFGTGGDPASDKGFSVRDLQLPQGIELSDLEMRRNLRDVVNGRLKQLEAGPAVLDTMDSFAERAYGLLTSEEVRNAFDLSQEPDSVKDAYGRGKYLAQGHYGASLGSQAGMRMLLARRLVEAGARFVTLSFGGWDNHVQLREVYERQMPPLDHALAALINDLDERGLLDSTLVWVASEFGRTPKINSAAGRDHWSRVFSLGLAGGGLKRGLIYGASDATSSDPVKDPLPLHDLHSTIYKLIGINSDKELMAPGERPIEIVDDGRPVDALIA